MIKRASPIIISFFFLISLTLDAQDTVIADGTIPVFDSLKLLYPFLIVDENHIRGDSTALIPVFDKLQKIEEGDCGHAVVVHIGDSHIQAGFVTQPIRDGLQQQFGNAGLGLIFPYRVAKSNGPPGYVSHADTPWIASRNASPKQLLPTGISGFTLWSDQPSPSFTVEFTSPKIYGACTSTLTIFHASRDSCSTFSVSNEINGIPYPISDSSRVNSTAYQLGDQPGKIRIRAHRTIDSLQSATFYGMNLTSEAPGVIVHTIGVNGATFENYLHAEHFVEQLADLHPDLLIISLGTNEAAGYKNFETTGFVAMVDSLMMKIRLAGIEAGVLFTTPPGIYKSYRKKRRTHYKPNPVAETVSIALKDYACKNGMCYWDWYTIMGGPTAMAKWKAKKMTDKKYIHFSSKGYGIQGLLLYEAIRQSYYLNNSKNKN
jgi:lysophospholipase L1-like esterase